MIKHIVSYKLKDNSLEKCLEAKQVLLSMEGKVKYIRSIEVGIDFLDSERSYDLVLIMTFNSKEDMEKYQNDEFHCVNVKPYLHEARLTSVAVDYII